MTVRVMAERRELGPGERAERAKRLKFYAVAAGLGLPGFVIGVAIGRRAKTHGFGEGLLTPELAVALAVIYLLAVGVGAWLMHRNMDEHARTQQLWFTAYGGAALVYVYPAWFLLWRGGLLPEPHHLAMFLIFYAGALLGFTVRYFRRSR